MTPLRFTGVRGVIARRMAESLATTAQLSFFTDTNATKLVEARKSWAEAGHKVGYEDLIIATLARILPAHPLMNALETEEGVIPQPGIHVGVAIALPGSLVVPAIFDCQAKSVPEIAEARASLVERAPKNKLTVREMSGATISLSNLGLTRVRHFTPILNRPQTAIIGLGQIADRPWVVDGAVIPRPVLGLSLTVDHRAIDGAPAGAFITDLATALEDNPPLP
jgi:pyruvate dehydrogenase E2 component (dihydrolipoamide acetyltransferase)